MRKLGDIAIIYVLVASLVGCGGRNSDADEGYSPVRPGVSEETEVKGTEVLEDNTVTVQVSSEIEEIEKGFSAVRYEGKDGFAAFGIHGGLSAKQGAAMIVGILTGTLCWWLVLSGITAHFRGRIRGKIYQWLNCVLGCLMTGFGLIMVVQGIVK